MHSMYYYIRTHNFSTECCLGRTYVGPLATRRRRSTRRFAAGGPLSNVIWVTFNIGLFWLFDRSKKNLSTPLTEIQVSVL